MGYILTGGAGLKFLWRKRKDVLIILLNNMMVWTVMWLFPLQGNKVKLDEHCIEVFKILIEKKVDIRRI